MGESSNLTKNVTASIDRLQQIHNHFRTRCATKQLNGKICVITGVGNELGIGWATAVLFAKEGARHLYLLDLAGEALPKLSSEIRGHNSQTAVTTYTGDASDEKLIQSICQTAIDDHGHLDVFFANAGVATGAPLNSTKYTTAEKVFKINALSCWLAVKYASETMLKNKSDFRGGSVILTASVAGIRSGAGSTEYSASKAAVISLAHTGANAYPGANIRVNAICPGLIQTQMTGPIFKAANDKSKVGQLCSLRRYGISDEVATVVTFLAGNDSSYVNGATIPVDGGLSSSVPVIPGKAY